MKLFVELSEASEQDLEDIFDYPCSQHGVEQAFNYVASFDDVFDSLAVHPELGRSRPEVRHGLLSIIKDNHVVFYRILNDRIRIIRILHGARDLPRRFRDLSE